MSALSALLLVALLLACVVAPACAYVVPGSLARDYKQGDKLEVHVNALYSNVTAITYDFYSMPFCSPKGKARVDESLGEWFLGGRIKQAPFGFTFLENEDKHSVCHREITSNKTLDRIVKLIKQKYKARLILDNIPVSRLSLETFFQMRDEYGEGAIEETLDAGYSLIGYDIGGKDKKGYYINNHLTFSVLYNSAEPKSLASGFYMGDGMAVTTEGPAGSTQSSKDGEVPEPAYNIVGFQVFPCSVDSEILTSEGFEADKCDTYNKQYLELGASIQYSFSVSYERTAIKWHDRWMPFMHTRGTPMHWYSFLDSVLIALLLAVLVASILLRTVRLDIRRFEQIAATPDPEGEETGWKFVSGDVFRAPPSPHTLALYIGSGFHLAFCLSLSLLFSVWGFISRVKRGGLMTFVICSYFIFAVLGGYYGVMYFIDISRSREGWRAIALKTGLFFPGIAISILTLMNIVLGTVKSTQSVPFLPMFIIFVMWMLLSVPLCFIGGYFASKRKPVDYPVKTNQIPREIATKSGASWLTHPLLLVMLSGLLPFGVMYIDLYFIFTAMFENFYYYAFGFLLGMAIVTAIVCVEMSIVSTYMLLCIEDYRWWWRSFYAGGSVALYFFLYGLSFLMFDSGLVGGLSTFVFLCYLSIMTLMIFLCMGALSFSVSYIFVRKIYASIKAD